MPDPVWSKEQLSKWHIQKTGNSIKNKLVVPDNGKLRQILQLAKHEMSICHPNVIGDKDYDYVPEEEKNI